MIGYRATKSTQILSTLLDKVSDGRIMEIYRGKVDDELKFCIDNVSTKDLYGHEVDRDIKRKIKESYERSLDMSEAESMTLLNKFKCKDIYGCGIRYAELFCDVQQQIHLKYGQYSCGYSCNVLKNYWERNYWDRNYQDRKFNFKNPTYYPRNTLFKHLWNMGNEFRERLIENYELPYTVETELDEIMQDPREDHLKKNDATFEIECLVELKLRHDAMRLRRGMNVPDRVFPVGDALTYFTRYSGYDLQLQITTDRTQMGPMGVNSIRQLNQWVNEEEHHRNLGIVVP